MISDILARRTQDIIRDIDEETNPSIIRALARELNEAMLRQERRRVAQKLQSLHGNTAGSRVQRSRSTDNILCENS